MTASSRVHTSRSDSVRHRWLWLMWLLIFVAFSYKMKVLGEPAVRPLYLTGVAFGCFLLLFLGQRAQRLSLAWNSIAEATVAGLLLIIIGYIFVQSLLYPASFDDVVYSVTTVFLLLVVSTFAVMAFGWETVVVTTFRALLTYSLVNIALVVLGFVYPAALRGILVSPLESGFGTRISGLPGDPTHLGSLFAVTLLLMFILRHRIPERMIGRALLIFIFLIVTGSRNALLSLLVGSLVASLAESKVAASVIRAVVMAALLAVGGALIVAADSDVTAYVASLFRIDDPNAYSRFSIWRDMGELMGQMSVFERLFGGGYLYIQDIYGSPYNAFLKIFFSHGVFVLLVFASCIICLFLCGVLDRSPLRRQVILGLLSYWLSFSMFLDTAFAEFFHFSEWCLWLAAALVLTRSLRARDARPAPLLRSDASPAHGGISAP